MKTRVITRDDFERASSSKREARERETFIDESERSFHRVPGTIVDEDANASRRSISHEAVIRDREHDHDDGLVRTARASECDLEVASARKSAWTSDKCFRTTGLLNITS